MNIHPILIVEDDDDDRSLILDAFAAIGKTEQVCFFSSGSDLLAYLDALPFAQHPALVVLDYNMPKLNGKDILTRLRGHLSQAKVPVIVFSSGFTPRMREELGELQVLACIQKGDNFYKLVEQVRYFTEVNLGPGNVLADLC